jgi:hypothetical protein
MCCKDISVVVYLEESIECVAFLKRSPQAFPNELRRMCSVPLKGFTAEVKGNAKSAKHSLPFFSLNSFFGEGSVRI